MCCLSKCSKILGRKSITNLPIKSVANSFHYFFGPCKNKQNEREEIAFRSWIWVKTQAIFVSNRVPRTHFETEMSTIETFSENIINMANWKKSFNVTDYTVFKSLATQLDKSYWRSIYSRSSKNRTSHSSTLFMYLPPLICAHKSRGSRGVYFPPSYTCYKRRSSTIHQ